MVYARIRGDLMRQIAALHVQIDSLRRSGRAGWNPSRPAGVVEEIKRQIAALTERMVKL